MNQTLKGFGLEDAFCQGNKLYPGSSGKSKYYYYDDYYDDYYYDYDYDYDYALQRGVGCLQTFSLLRWFHNTQYWVAACPADPSGLCLWLQEPSLPRCAVPWLGPIFLVLRPRSLLLSPTMNAAMHGLKV